MNVYAPMELEHLVYAQVEAVGTVVPESVIQAQVGPGLFIDHEPDPRPVSCVDVFEHINVRIPVCGRAGVKEDHAAPSVLFPLQGEPPFGLGIDDGLTAEPALWVAPAGASELVPPQCGEVEIGQVAVKLKVAVEPECQQIALTGFVEFQVGPVLRP